MAVTSPFVVYVGGTAWDLRKVSAVIEPPDAPSIVRVRFIDNPHNTITLDRATFTAAWQAALDAGMAGGGSPSGSAGGDLSGTYPNPLVKQVTPTGKTLTYNVDGTLNVVTDAWGTKTMVYAGGKLTQVIGTGIYKTKDLNYTGDKLTSIPVS